MIVLGISPLDKDSTVSLLANGRVLFAAGEERFSRLKLQDGFPAKALQAALDHTRVCLEDIDIVVYPFFEWQKETQLFTKNLCDEQKLLEITPLNGMSRHIERALAQIPPRAHHIPGLSSPNETVVKPMLHKLLYRLAGSEGLISRNIAKRGSRVWRRDSIMYHKAWQEELEHNLRARGLLDKLRRYDHHLAHAAAAYFASGFDRSLIVTLDGYGSGLAGSVCIGEGSHLRRIHRLEYPHSLGTFYESVTSSLGFKPARHEGKIVGLAAYGDPNLLLDVILSRFQQEPGTFRFLESNNIY